MRKIFLFAMLVVLSVLAHAQTGVYENFNDNQLAAGWVMPASGVVAIESNAELNLNVTSISGYNNVSYTFASVDISGNQTVQLKVKSNQAFTLRIDLVDNSGNSTNFSASTQAITASNTYTNYTFNFSGKFKQSSPVSATVNNKSIVKAVFFFNAGATFSGNVYFDDLIIGDQIAIFPGTIRKNQIGYEAAANKIALIESNSNSAVYTDFSICTLNDSVKFSGLVGAWKQVAGWSGRYFRAMDFSAFKIPGTYKLLIDNAYAGNIVIAKGALFSSTAPSVISFFKGMRSTNIVDHTLSFNGPRNDAVDVYGGWIDATGDPGKHFSHLSYANHFNPQQIPMVAWSMMKSYEMDSTAFLSFKTETNDEIVWGTDYLVRSLDNAGYFYLSVFDDWGGSPSSREICEWSGSAGTRSANYQCAMREGAGMAIAALARASYMHYKGTYTSQQYLNAAIKAYAHLKSAGNGYATKNLEYCNDHAENIIDDYCGLLAAVELYKASGTASYLTDATAFYNSLVAKQQSEGWFSSDVAGNRPFYHAADEGLPVVAIVEYSKVVANAAAIKTVLNKWISWYIKISKEVENPFSYVRQYQKAYANSSLQAAKKAFFLPHQNETGYWWQGENARLASMSTAFLSASRVVNPSYNMGSDSLSLYAVSQLDWIVGKNPFGICMVTGFGERTYAGYIGKTNVKGGICNGIAADTADNGNVSFMPYAVSDWHNWRWIEQWLPHDSWYLLAISSVSALANHTSIADCNGEVGGAAFMDSCSVCAGGTTGNIPIVDPKACTTGLSPAYEVVVRIFPNPTNSILRVDAQNIIQVSVYNSLGDLLLEANSNVVDLSAVDNGLYLVKVQTASGVAIEKVMKMKE
ncbi:MAG: glycoside hydrolase family 9 protein [Bacteroidetes bacterium]|nr:glycoside hydrolase family 9 protein [Bacteroidota bacterium]